MITRRNVQDAERMALLRSFMKMEHSSDLTVRIMDRVGSMPSTQKEQEAKRIRLAIQDCKTEEEITAVLDEMGIEKLEEVPDETEIE